MRSYAGIIGASNDRLLEHLGGAIRLPGSSPPLLHLDGDCGLATTSHRPDREAPILANDGTARLAGDIRLDDRRSLARALGADYAASDHDLTLRAWRRWGEGCADRLYGDYSLAIWDGKARELFCVRDRFGVRPFYYAAVGSDLVFSDSLAAVIAHPDVDADTLDDAAVAGYLLTGVSEEAAATIYAGVRRLPAGHVLRFRPGLAPDVRCYWRLEGIDADDVRDDVQARLESALRSAIADRVTGTSAMVFMSGGLDSTSIAALAHETLPNVELTAGTSVYRTRIADEEERYATEAARSIGIPIQLFALDAYAPLGALDKGLWTAEPGPLLSAEMTRDIYAGAAAASDTALHGHPADALLIGELTPYLMGLVRRGQIARFVSALVRYTRIRGRLPYFIARHLLSRRRVAAPLAVPAWLEPSFAEAMAERQAARAEDVNGEGVRPQAAAALRSAVWSSYFEWAHPLMTGAPIELAYPFCDARVVDAAMTAAPIPAMVDKHVLREILRGRVSEMVRTRRKTSLTGDPWTAAAGEERLAISAARGYVDPRRFADACRTSGSLADATLRAVAFEYWMSELPGRVRLARNALRRSV